MKKMVLATILLVIFTAILTATATFNYVIVNQEIEKTENGYSVYILGNIYNYE